MSESARGEGGRVWVPKTPGDKRDPKSIPENERWYFLEEWYPKYGNLVPRDIATRAIHKVVYEHNLGIDGKPMVYLDLTHIDRKMLDRKLEGILEIYEKFVGDDPRDTPMKIFPGMHYTMGGLWVDFNQATNIPGILRRRRVRIPVSRRQSPGREFAGLLHLRRIRRRAQRCAVRSQPEGRTQQRLLRSRAQAAGRKQRHADEVGWHRESVPLWRELGDLMTKNCTVIRYNKNLQETDAEAVQIAGALPPHQPERPHAVGQHIGRLRAAALQHAATGASDRPGRRHARRIARRTLQARFPRARRQELAEDDQSDFRAGCRRAEV